MRMNGKMGVITGGDAEERVLLRAQIDASKLDNLLERYKFLQRFRPTPANTSSEDILAEHGIQAMVDSLMTMKHATTFARRPAERRARGTCQYRAS